jgi:hypothetical protein
VRGGTRPPFWLIHSLVRSHPPGKEASTCPRRQAGTRAPAA